jgi:hypothetical protein
MNAHSFPCPRTCIRRTSLEDSEQRRQTRAILKIYTPRPPFLHQASRAHVHHPTRSSPPSPPPPRLRHHTTPHDPVRTTNRHRHGVPRSRPLCTIPYAVPVRRKAEKRAPFDGRVRRGTQSRERKVWPRLMRMLLRLRRGRARRTGRWSSRTALSTTARDARAWVPGCGCTRDPDCERSVESKQHCTLLYRLFFLFPQTTLMGVLYMGTSPAPRAACGTDTACARARCVEVVCDAQHINGRGCAVS